jgi:uncharacterized protein (TIGR02453 family)
MTEPPFRGFPAEATEFYADLELDNSREFWLANKPVFERAVRGPMRALLDALDPDPGAFHVFRPNRDVRFSSDKSPYKTQHGAGATSPGGTIRYVHISAEGLFIASGCYVLAPDQIARMRAAIDDEEAGEGLRRVLAAVEDSGLEIGPGGAPPLKTAPRGYPKDHPRIDLLRLKGLVAFETVVDPAIVETAAALQRVRASWEAAGPMNAWLERHVGPSTEPRGRFGR